MKHARILLAAFSAAVFCGCSPYILHCRYFYLTPQDQLTVVQTESSFAPECGPLPNPIPTVWRLERPNYVIEFALGDRWYPQLMADAHDQSGAPLAIVSSQLVESRTGDKKRPISLRGKSYRYFSRGADGNSGVLIFEVQDQAGQVRGAEKVSFEIREAKSVKMETI